MGNEGSLPAGEDTEGFEYQARFPPSAIPPPGDGQAYIGATSNDPRVNGAHQQQQYQQQQQQQQQQQGRSAGGGREGGGVRLKGGVFTRRSHAHKQISTGIERAPEHSAMNAPSDYPSPAYQAATNIPMPGNDLAYISAGGGGQPQHHQHQHQHQPYPTHPQHQQQYSQHQQQMYVQQYQQQQHQQQYQQQQQYHPQGQQPQHYQQHPKKSRPGQRAGAAILNGMRNLNIGSAMNRIGGGGKSPFPSPNRVGSRWQQNQRRNQQQVNVNEWETRWDEDSDEEDEDGKTNGLPQQHSVPTTQLAPQLRPPELDSGYAGAASAAAAVVSPAKPPTTDLQSQQQQQQQQQQQLYAPSNPTAAVVTPESVGSARTPNKSRPTVTDDENDDDDDGVEWDTGASAEGELDDTSTPNVKQFLPLLRVLGKGSFGKVVLVQKRVGRERGSLFAMKILKKSHLVRRRQIERTRTERKVLSAVNHPFIMKLHYAFQTPDKLYLVLDYCPGGELFFHLSRFRRFPERVARFYAAELLLALGHLHKRGIIYRDLKPENVLLDADGHVKLGDFGLAKAGIRHAYEGATSMCGTPEYMAPEVLSQQGHGFCVDYWGLGMLTYEMMTGLPPWYTTDRAKLFRRLRSAPLDIPPYFSPASAAFATALLERNPRRRLGVTGIRSAMENDFFKSISWRALYGRRVEAPIRPCEGWSPPGKESPTPEQQQPGGIPTDLDAATANFDNQFTRMPVDSVNETGDDDEELEELHEDTFVGFTFDDRDRDEIEAAHHLKQQQMLQRTQ
eukprot:CAMPEP_0197178902 /NCGR_PEP_ID=MMETSP1423-20130617/4025_1 /TAXON_ID=476441 /ORGANISM="Pseudo-nitzschia heimii, Strain UNC1101" /LENGTH=784 /DNA_ID=CAMNT_0042628721 /DNA_START=383 /DNA_END=2734 /DNA_ORIENTATION=+